MAEANIEPWLTLYRVVYEPKFTHLLGEQDFPFFPLFIHFSFENFFFVTWGTLSVICFERLFAGGAVIFEFMTHTIDGSLSEHPLSSREKRCTMSFCRPRPFEGCPTSRVQKKTWFCFFIKLFSIVPFYEYRFSKFSKNRR